MKQEMLGIRGMKTGKQTRVENNYDQANREVRRKGVAKQGNTRTILVKIHESKSKVLLWRWPRQDPWLAFGHSISSYPVGTVLPHHRLSRSKIPIF